MSNSKKKDYKVLRTLWFRPVNLLPYMLLTVCQSPYANEMLIFDKQSFRSHY